MRVHPVMLLTIAFCWKGRLVQWFIILVLVYTQSVILVSLTLTGLTMAMLLVQAKLFPALIDCVFVASDPMSCFSKWHHIICDYTYLTLPTLVIIQLNRYLITLQAVLPRSTLMLEPESRSFPLTVTMVPPARGPFNGVISWSSGF